MKKKRGGALALPCASNEELFIRDIEASAQKVLRKANKVQFSAILAEARKPPKLLVNGGGHGNRKSASCSPPKRCGGGGSSCKLTTVLSKQQVGIGGAPSSSTSSPKVDSVVGSVDGNYKFDYYNNSYTTTSLPRRVKSNWLKEDCCDITNKAVKKNSSQELPTAALAQLTRNATPGIHHSKATTTQYPSNIESSKTKATCSSFLSSFSVAQPHSSTPVSKKLGGKQRLSTHSLKRKLRMNGGEKERRQCHPISWNIDDLRTKYRSEEIRRRDHKDTAVAKATTAAEDILVSEGGMFSVDLSSVTTTTAANPHPLHKALKQQLDIEISRSLLHAAAKSRKQRFSLDMHQVWVSNLSHLKEFKEIRAINRKSAALYSECQTSHVREVILASSLGNRRDTEAILAENSQIQSVSMLRAFDKAIKGYPAPWKMDSDAWFSKEKESKKGGGRTTNKNNDYEGVKVNDLLPNLLPSASFVCLQRAHIYRFMSLSSTQQQQQHNNGVQIENGNNESPQRNAYSIQIDRCCPRHKAAADGREEIIKEDATWVIRWCHLFEKGGNNRGGYSGGVHLSESVANKCVFNAIQKGNLIEGRELCSSVFKLRQLNALGEVTNHIYCFMRFGLKPAVLKNGIRNILSVVAYPLTGNLRSIGPQKTIIAVGDLLGNMGLASPVHVLFSDVRTNEYIDYLKNQLICNGARAFAFGPIGPIGSIMEMGATTEKMKLLVVPQGSCTNDGLLLLPPISLSTLQLLHARTVACAMLCLLQLKENHEEEGILLQQTVAMTVEEIENNTKGVLFHRLHPSEISHWEEEERFRIAEVQEDQFLQGKKKVGDGRRQVNDMMCTEVIFSGIIKQHANNTAAANPSSHHPIFASFFCDNTRSSTNSTMVHLTTATPDVPMIMDSVTVHENKMLVPNHLPHDPRPDNRPLVFNPMPRKELLQLSSQSEVAKVYNLVEGFAPGIMVLNCLSQIEDYTFEGLLEEREAFKAGVHHRRGLKGTALGPFIRAIENTTIPPASSSLTCVLSPLAPCDKLETLSYGITRQAAVGNVTRVKGRCIFHSNQRCIEQFSRKRTPKDYAYISKTRLMVGIGDASCHYVTLIHQQIRGIFRVSRKRYEMDQKETEEKRRKQENEAALDAMAIAGKAKLERNRLKLETNARLLAEKRRQEALEGDPLAAARMRKWQKRLIGSELLETWMEWEMRQDIEGSIFYRCLNPHNQLQFSWDAPLEWGKETEGNNKDNSTLLYSTATATGSSSSSNGRLDNNNSDDYYCEIEKTTNDKTSVLIGAPSNNNSSGSGNIISELVENDRLIEGIAKRLGIVPNLNQAAAASMSDSTPSKNTEEDKPHNNDTEGDKKIVNLKSSSEEQHDLISDSEDEAGHDEDMPPDGLPQDYRDVMSLHGFSGRLENEKDDSSMMTLQHLALSSGKGITKRNEDGEHIHGMEWRKLGSDHAPRGLKQKIAIPQAIAAAVSDPPTSKNTTLKPRIVGKVDLKYVTKRDSSIPVPQKPLFIQDILKENSRVFDQSHKQQQQQQQLDDPVNDGNTTAVSDLFELGGSQDLDLTSVDRERRRKREMEVNQVIATEELQRKAIVACTAGNMESLGAALDEGNLSVETSDSQGNTLLLVATQQGNKHLVKMLLRRGAKINAQNGDGYSVLHFCFQHGRHKLAEYLKSKGADDTLVNSQGITCYEAGLSKHDLETF